MVTGWRGFLIWGVGEEGASSDTAIEWEVSVLGVCLPACLPLCCLEGGRGWACSCLGRAAPVWDTAPLSGDRLTASLPTHLNSLRGALGQPLLSKKIVEVSFSRWSCQPSERCSGNGPGWESPQRGVVSSGWVCTDHCSICGARIQSSVVGVCVCVWGGALHQGPGVPQCWVPGCRVGHRPSPGNEGARHPQGADELREEIPASF